MKKITKSLELLLLVHALSGCVVPPIESQEDTTQKRKSYTASRSPIASQQPSTGPSITPISAAASETATTPTLSPIIQSVVSGGENSCAIIDGAAYCWGRNDMGQLGAGIRDDRRAEPVAVKGLGKNVTSISIGPDGLVCAVAGGAVYCWGKQVHDYYYLSKGETLQFAYEPVQVQGLSEGVTAVVAGLRHACAIMRGGVQCWGSNNEGELGLGFKGQFLWYRPQSEWGTFSATPKWVLGMTSGVTAIAGGGSHTCAVQHGRVFCWGLGNWGQTGFNSSVYRHYDSSGVPNAIAGLPGSLKALSAGTNHTCALSTSSGIFCWGRNMEGQLGKTPYSQGGPIYTNVAAAVPLSENVGLPTYLASAGDRNCMVLQKGVICWGGTNLFGSTVIGVSQYLAERQFRELWPLGYEAGAENVSVGLNHGCALRSGRVECWGLGSQGQLGTGSYLNSGYPLLVVQ